MTITQESRHQHGAFDRTGGFKYVLFSPPTWGNDPSLTHIFQMGWFNHQLNEGFTWVSHGFPWQAHYPQLQSLFVDFLAVPLWSSVEVPFFLVEKMGHLDHGKFNRRKAFDFHNVCREKPDFRTGKYGFLCHHFIRCSSDSGLMYCCCVHISYIHNIF